MRRTADGPIFIVTQTLSAHAEAPAHGVRFGGQAWYVAAGRPDEPAPWFEEGLGLHACGRCGSADVRVVAFQEGVHPHSGDLYWDCEVRCLACGAYTAASYAEN